MAPSIEQRVSYLEGARMAADRMADQRHEDNRADIRELTERVASAAKRLDTLSDEMRQAALHAHTTLMVSLTSGAVTVITVILNIVINHVWK